MYVQEAGNQTRPYRRLHLVVDVIVSLKVSCFPWYQVNMHMLHCLTSIRTILQDTAAMQYQPLAELHASDHRYYTPGYVSIISMLSLKGIYIVLHDIRAKSVKIACTLQIG